MSDDVADGVNDFMTGISWLRSQQEEQAVGSGRAAREHCTKQQKTIKAAIAETLTVLPLPKALLAHPKQVSISFSPSLTWAVCVWVRVAVAHLSPRVCVFPDSIEDDFELSTVCHRPEGLEQLQGQTQFSKKELQVLYRGFKTECPSGVVNEETFKQIYSQFFPQGDSSMYAHFLFNAFDTDLNGSVSFENFVMGLSVILRGTVDDKLNWAFNLYDLNKDGSITREEMLDIMKSIYDMMGKYTFPSVRDESPREHVETFFQVTAPEPGGTLSNPDLGM
eukprot:gi/632974851/ref/XP_007903905.1/ PREDICTED: Kv channel-interacting protein 2 [Callorhinchus milii]